MGDTSSDSPRPHDRTTSSGSCSSSPCNRTRRTNNLSSCPAKKKRKKDRPRNPGYKLPSSSSSSSPEILTVFTRSSTDEQARLTGETGEESPKVTCIAFPATAPGPGPVNGRRRAKRRISNSDDSEHPRLQPQDALVVGTPSQDNEALREEVRRLWAEKEEVASERDRAVAEKEEKDRAVKEMAAERDQAVAEKEEMAAERDRAVKEVANERDLAVAEKKEIAAERDKLAEENHLLKQPVVPRQRPPIPVSSRPKSAGPGSAVFLNKPAASQALRKRMLPPTPLKTSAQTNPPKRRRQHLRSFSCDAIVFSVQPHIDVQQTSVQTTPPNSHVF